MTKDVFIDICDNFTQKQYKLRLVRFIKESTQCNLRRAKCDIADVCFTDNLIDPYELLTDEEKINVKNFKKRKVTYE